MKRVLTIVVLTLIILLSFQTANASGFGQVELPPITAESLAVIIATFVTLMLDYFPGLAAWWDALAVATKKLIMVGLAIIISGGVFVLVCSDLVVTNMVCTYAGAWDLIANVIFVFIVGQAIHAGTKPTNALKIRMGISPKLA